MKQILEQLEQKRAAARLGGGQKRIDAQHGKGKLTVHFYSDDQLKAFANLLGQYSVE